MRSFLIAVSFIIVFFPVHAQEPDTLAIPGVRLIRNIRYGGKDAKQNFDLYLPAHAASPAPLVIWIHGGGWRMGNKKDMEIAYLAGYGYAIASVDYRFSRDSVFPAQVRDCNDAIAGLWRDAAKFGLDTSRFVLAGASAGGHLAALIGMSANNDQPDFYTYPSGGHSPSFKAVLDFYGPGDLYAFHGDGPGYKVDSAGSSVSLLLGGPALLRPDVAKWASPATYVDKNDPPVLVLHGDKDPIIPLYLGQLFYNVLKVAGVKTEMVTLKDAGHGGPAFSGDSVRQKVVAFLNEALSGPSAQERALSERLSSERLSSSGIMPAHGLPASAAVSLDGEWTFALDPVGIGQAEQWFVPAFPSGRFDKVTVPHCFSVDKRYEFYTGAAWYFKRFPAASVQPGYHRFLHFDAVFYKAKIWLNGQLIGSHEGGYTPFEFDVSDHLQTDNVLAVEVDNGWDTTTIPGAKTKMAYEAPDASQVYPWINYGGITRPVCLLTRPALFIKRIKVIAEPGWVKGKMRDTADLRPKGDAHITITALLENLTDRPADPMVSVRIYRDGQPLPVRFKVPPVTLPSGDARAIVMEAALPAKEVSLWDQDHPNLYSAQLSMGADTLSATFGIRQLQVKNDQLLLNGEPIHMGGANRPLDVPGYGSMDPDQVLEKDLTLMKSACIEFSRINHYPVPEYLLNWADRNGMLIIEEAGNWQMTPQQMSDPAMRAKYESQMKEMVERDWNHPCIIAWSVGNEFRSQTTEGKDWVKDMSRFVKGMDNTRFTTFASMMVGRDMIKKPEDEASLYTDFICTNIYDHHLERLRHIHALYPDKPVYVSEFGIRTDGVKDEGGRIAYLHKAMEEFRQCDFLIGACIWTFNDYRSRFPGTNPNGYRPWGLVTPQREPRGMYTAWQEEFSPAVITVTGRKDGQVTIRVTARKDFPGYTLRGYSIRSGGRIFSLPTLRPGAAGEVTIDLPSTRKNDPVEISLVKPGGFVILKKIFEP